MFLLGFVVGIVLSGIAGGIVYRRNIKESNKMIQDCLDIANARGKAYDQITLEHRKLQHAVREHLVKLDHSIETQQAVLH